MRNMEKQKTDKKSEKRPIYLRKLTLLIVFCALGVVLSQFTTFPVFGTMANPTQHAINAIIGVLLGPFWAVGGAIIIGVIRVMLGTGTMYAFPGGLPGAVTVGVFYWIFKTLKFSPKNRLLAALTEPLGTILIGVPLSLYMFAPELGTSSILSLVGKGPLIAFTVFGTSWALSCVPGCIVGFVILLALYRIGISREKLFGEK